MQPVARALAATALAFSSQACVPPAYEPPAASEPHAVLKLRRVYEVTAGTHLLETCDLNGYRALGAHAASGVATAPRTEAVLVHPVPAKIRMRSGFSHLELQTVTEPYTEQVSHLETESYSCGMGFQLCTRMVTRYSPETRYRTVTKYVDVSDGACGRVFYLAPVVGGVYLVDFTYRAPGVCSATCVEQTEIAEDGTFRSRPCPRPTAKQTQELDEE